LSLNVMSKAMATLDVIAAQRRVLVLGAASQTWLDALRRAGAVVDTLTPQQDVLALFESMHGGPDVQSCALVVAADGVAHGQSWLEEIVALGVLLGWQRLACNEVALLLVRDAGVDKRARWLTPHDAASMRQLFQSVFGHAMSAAHWDWKYAQGAGMGLGLWHDGKLVAHYGGTSRTVRAWGSPMLACQICDVMVAAQARPAGPVDGCLSEQANWQRALAPDRLWISERPPLRRGQADGSVRSC
jgi:Acetyltransferase (GNAT) domain